MSTKVIGDYTAAITIDGGTHYLLIQPGSSSTAYKKITRNVLLGVSGQPADISTVQSLTNKTLDNTNTITLKDTLFTLQDDGDTTKQAKFQLSGITTGTTRTYTLPNASSTLADIATAQTFTNKTLTSPVITGGTIDNSTITVDSIGEHTVANGVTIDGLNIKDGALNTNNSVITANITDAAVTPAKLIAGTGAGWAWQSYTPTWTGSGGNPAIGNGTISGAYIQTGKTVDFQIVVVMGGTTSYGSGSYRFSFPVTPPSPVAGQDLQSIGTFHHKSAASGNYFGWAVLRSGVTTYLELFYLTGVGASSGSSNVGATAPYSFANGDLLQITGSYQAA